MTSVAAVLALGFWLGMRHATDADHVVAVSTIVARTRKLGAACLLGAVWGLGHTVTILLVGSAIILLKTTIPPRVGLLMEFAVGVVLILLGLLNIAGYRLSSLGIKEHSHPHDHHDSAHHHELLGEHRKGQPHAHAHLHEVELGWLRRLAQDAGTFQLLRSAAVGLVHGLAGSAAVALLVLATIPTAKAAVFYLLIFGLGTLAGMLILSLMMELCMLYLTRWWETMDWLLTVGTGVLSLCFGLYVAYQIGFVDGLFSAHPHWTPQ